MLPAWTLSYPLGDGQDIPSVTVGVGMPVAELERQKAPQSADAVFVVVVLDGNDVRRRVKGLARVGEGQGDGIAVITVISLCAGFGFTSSVRMVRSSLCTAPSENASIVFRISSETLPPCSPLRLPICFFSSSSSSSVPNSAPPLFSASFTPSEYRNTTSCGCSVTVSSS